MQLRMFVYNRVAVGQARNSNIITHMHIAAAAVGAAVAPFQLPHKHKRAR